MSRPCFPFPATVKWGVVWAGDWEEPDPDFPDVSGTQVGPSGEGEDLLCGPGTMYPIGFTLEQLVRFAFSVRLWKVTYASQRILTSTNPDTTFTITANATYPAAYLTGLRTGIGSTSIGVDRCGSNYEAGLLLASYGGRIDLRSEEPIVAISGDTLNYTADELNALVSGSADGNVVGGPFPGPRTVSMSSIFSFSFSDLLSPGPSQGAEALFYPRIGAGNFQGSVGVATTVKDTSLDISAGNFTIVLGSQTKTCPIFAFVDPETTTHACSVTVEAVKYWPYKNAAGVALYNETTGALV